MKKMMNCIHRIIKPTKRNIVRVPTSVPPNDRDKRNIDSCNNQSTFYTREIGQNANKQ